MLPAARRAPATPDSRHRRSSSSRRSVRWDDIDHVDFSGIATVSTLYDVRQVEAFRGPQGTLYGANVLAGLVNVTTNDPTKVPEAE
jgi:outer membrane receptor protein involved in Fe transport